MPSAARVSSWQNSVELDPAARHALRVQREQQVLDRGARRTAGTSRARRRRAPRRGSGALRRTARRERSARAPRPSTASLRGDPALDHLLGRAVAPQVGSPRRRPIAASSARVAGAPVERARTARAACGAGRARCTRRATASSTHVPRHVAGSERADRAPRVQRLQRATRGTGPPPARGPGRRRAPCGASAGRAPRTTAAGTRAALPITSPLAAATSSASATTVASSARPA